MASRDQDRTYWQQRAEQEIELAQRAANPAAVAAHYQLAELYLERLAGRSRGEEGGPDVTKV